MPRSSLNTFSISGNEINIIRSFWPRMACTTYRPDYYDELTSKTWTLNNGYLSNSSLGLLHRYIMRKWYGDEVFDYFTSEGYVIDHLNNDGMDCRITNLEFLKKNYNVAKGQAFDVDAKKIRFRIAVNIFKDFTTDCYQISIGCNDPICGTDSDGERFYIQSITLLYDCNYAIVINDAENILLQYESEGKITISNTHACDSRICKAIDVQLTEEEKNGAIVIRDGVPYLVLGTGNTFILSAHYDEGWIPPKKC